jgi:putative transposase
VGVAIGPANLHDKHLVEPTLQGMGARRPRPSRRRPQHLCADKGYDYRDTRSLLRRRQYTIHIPRRGESQRKPKRLLGYRARRWVVERTHSWMNRFRRILVRWEKKEANYLGFLHLVLGLIAFRMSGVLG